MKYTLTLTSTLGLILTFCTNQENIAVMKYTLTQTLTLTLRLVHISLQPYFLDLCKKLGLNLGLGLNIGLGLT